MRTGKNLLLQHRPAQADRRYPTISEAAQVAFRLSAARYDIQFLSEEGAIKKATQ